MIKEDHFACATKVLEALPPYHRTPVNCGRDFHALAASDYSLAKELR
jgi:hypothetical protein